MIVCPICGEPARKYEKLGDWEAFGCTEACGDFRISGSLAEAWPNDLDVAAVQAWLDQERQRGPMICTHDLDRFPRHDSLGRPTRCGRRSARLIENGNV